MVVKIPVAPFYIMTPHCTIDGYHPPTKQPNIIIEITQYHNPEYHNINIQYERHIFIILLIMTTLARIYWTHSILGHSNDFHFT